MPIVTVTPKTARPVFIKTDLIIYKPNNKVILVTAVNEDLSINGVVISDESPKQQQLGTGQWVSNYDTSLYELFHGTITLEQ